MMCLHKLSGTCIRTLRSLEKALNLLQLEKPHISIPTRNEATGERNHAGVKQIRFDK